MKLIIDIDKNLVCEGFVRNFTEEEKDVLISAVRHGIPYEERQHEKWEYLKEHIADMCNADGESKLNQKQTCQFILNLMGVIEREGDENGI